MAPAPRCPICISMYFGSKEPITISCGHTLCKECLQGMIQRARFLSCPICKQSYSDRESYSLLSLRPNIDIKAMMDNLKTTCWEHEAIAEKVCTTHVQAVCDQCVGHRECTVLSIADEFDMIQIDIKRKIKSMKKQSKQTLSRPLEDEVQKALRKSLDDLLKLHKAVFSELFGPDLTDPREAILTDGKKHLRKINSFFLPFDFLSRWYNPPDTHRACSQLTEDLQRYKDIPFETSDSLPELVCCMNCMICTPRDKIDMVVLPCFQVYHVICRPCAVMMVQTGQVTCRLDGNSYSIQAMDKLPAFAPRPPVKNGTLLPAHPQDFFGYTHSVSLFRHVMPPEFLPLSVEKTSQMVGFTVNFSYNQVEAITFMPMADAVIGGITLANPVSSEDQASIEWVKLYLSSTAAGEYRYCMQGYPKVLIGGKGVMTNILLDEEVPVSAYSVYTFKLKLTGKKEPDNKMVFYRGNHLTGYVNAIGSRDDAWEFSQTLGFDSEDRCLGKHFQTGPILRILYR